MRRARRFLPDGQWIAFESGAAIGESRGGRRSAGDGVTGHGVRLFGTLRTELGIERLHPVSSGLRHRHLASAGSRREGRHRSATKLRAGEVEPSQGASILPGGRVVLYDSNGVRCSRSRSRRASVARLCEATGAKYLSTGHRGVRPRRNRLCRAWFDVERLEYEGNSWTAVVQDVRQTDVVPQYRPDPAQG